mmetsp:Transcript_108059/g.304403  ORF Transcript_108059/g.304403 Transcript_108059/m.304403 type:complete len:298 (+) Transcript_108059:110-1003(+)
MLPWRLVSATKYQMARLCSRRLRATELCALCSTSALCIISAVYVVAGVGRTFVGEDHASYAVNLSRLLCLVGFARLAFHLWRADHAEAFSSLWLLAELASNVLELLGMFVHPNPSECYVPGSGFLGSSWVWALLVAAESGLFVLALFQLRRIHWSGLPRPSEMETSIFWGILLVFFSIQCLTKSDCGSPLGDAIWTLAYAFDDVALIPQMWLVAQTEAVPWQLASCVVFSALGTMVELFSDIVGMRSEALAGSQYAGNCCMYVWSDFLALAISSDFVYWYFQSLSRSSKPSAMEVPL